MLNILLRHPSVVVARNLNVFVAGAAVDAASRRFHSASREWDSALSVHVVALPELQRSSHSALASHSNMQRKYKRSIPQSAGDRKAD